MKASTINNLVTVVLLMTSGVRLSGAGTADSDLITNDTIEAVRNHFHGSEAESAIIITDRETYIAGEHVWYFMNVFRNNTDRNWRSIAGYAEILNCQSMPVAQSRIILDDHGRGSGMLSLPDTISSGDYLLRGYTRAMIPFGPEKYFSKLIRVFNPYSGRDTYMKIIPAGNAYNTRLMLFATERESDSGSDCRVLVKATGLDGGGRATSIVFLDPDGNPIDTVSTDFSGMGSAILTFPDNGVLSAMAVIDSVKTEGQISLKKTYSPSFTIAKRTGPGVHFTIQRPAGEGKWQADTLHLAVANKSQIIFYRKVAPEVSAITPDLTLPGKGEGVLQALLYDSRGILLSSRLFLADGSYRAPSVAEPARFVTGDDSITVSLPGGVSYAVLSAACAEDDAPDIHAWSMLQPWLNASVLNDPFVKPFLTGKVPINDDLLFILGETDPKPEPPDPEGVVAETMGLAVTGSVFDLDTQQPASDKILFINIPGKQCFLQYVKSNSSGRFTFIIPPGVGTGEIVVYPQDTSANYVLKIDSPFSQDYLQMQYRITVPGKMADPAALRMSINSQVMRLYDLTDTDTLLNPPVIPIKGHFYGRTGQHLQLSDYIMLPNLEELFFELITGVNLVKSRNKYEFRINDPKTGKEIKESPLLFIDGTYNTDPEVIAELSPEKTEYIDVILKHYRLGALLLPPIISVITKKGDFRLQKLPRSALRIKYLFSDATFTFLPFSGDASGRIPVYGNTLLWSAFPVEKSNDKVSTPIPLPDYNTKIRLTLTVFGSEKLPLSYSCLRDLTER